MSYEVKQGNIFGRIGKGLAQGLSEQVPKEIERARLSSGLQQFEQESANLSPIQQLARLSAIPGITPQMIQSFGELARQQARGNALGQQNQPKPFPFPQNQSKNLAPGSNVPSITQQQPLEKFIEGYIPKSQDEIIADAGQRYNENPALYNNDPQKAIDAAISADLRNQEIANAYEKKHKNLTDIQDNVVKRLQDQSTRLNVKIPANVYSKIEDEAIRATKPKNQGGRGLTEQQAMKEYGEELDARSRDYQAIDSIGNWGIVAKPAKDTLTNIKALQAKFEKYNDTENFADSLIEKNKLSPKLAYSLAQPVSKFPSLNNELKKIPPLPRGKITGSQGMLVSQAPKIQDIRQKTLEVSQKLAPLLGEKGSPLSVAYELEKKGYDPNIWINYLIDNRQDLDLKESQGRQLDKPNSLTGTLNDWWLSSWSGIEGTK